MTVDLEATAQKLRTGGRRMLFHADGSDRAIWMYRSVLDRRVTLCKTLHRKSRKETKSFAFGDEAVEISVTPGGPIVEEADARSFGTIEELVAAIVAHDRELGREREWMAAAPADGDRS